MLEELLPGHTQAACGLPWLNGIEGGQARCAGLSAFNDGQPLQRQLPEAAGPSRVTATESESRHQN